MVKTLGAVIKFDSCDVTMLLVGHGLMLQWLQWLVRGLGGDFDLAIVRMEELSNRAFISGVSLCEESEPKG